jgi:hypothetical protein
MFLREKNRTTNSNRNAAQVGECVAVSAILGIHIHDQQIE